MKKKSLKNIKTVDDDFKKLVGLKDAAYYVRTNEYIIKGYRANCYTFKNIFKSLFYIHNESVNVWSHIIGSLFVISFFIYIIISITSYSNLQYLKNHFVSEIDKYLSFSNLKFNLTVAKYFSIIYNKIKNNIIKDYNYCIEIIDKNIISTISNILKNKFSTEISKLLKNFELLSKTIKTLKDYNNSSISIHLETWPLYAFLACALFCLTASSCYHLMGIYSEKLYNFLHRLDYAGISILISGSCYPAIFYFFYTLPNIRNLYIAMNTTFGVIVLFCSFFQFFGKPEMKPFRGILYTVMGLSDAIPLFHICFFSKSVYGELYDCPRFVFWYIGGACYIIGCILYVKKFPEKAFPNTFDYFGSSHQIFHILIVVGVVTHFIASLDAYEFRLRNIIA